MAHLVVLAGEYAPSFGNHACCANCFGTQCATFPHVDDRWRGQGRFIAEIALFFGNMNRVPNATIKPGAHRFEPLLFTGTLIQRPIIRPGTAIAFRGDGFRDQTKASARHMVSKIAPQGLSSVRCLSSRHPTLDNDQQTKARTMVRLGSLIMPLVL